MSVTAMPKTEGAAEEAKPKKSKKKLIIILLVLILAGGGGYMMFRPKPAEAAKPGIVVPLDPIQINLAGEHYLRVGIALQLTDATKEADGSKALDALINEFSGKSIADVTNPTKRREMQKELVHQLGELYEKEVMNVYFTEFVTQ